MRRTPIRRVSKKRRDALPAYALARGEAFAAADGLCVAKLVGCTGGASEAHHWHARGRGGSFLPGETQKLIPLCASCHRFVTDNTRAARTLGLLR